MTLKLRMAITAIVVCAIIGLARPTSLYAATILEMSLGDATNDIEFDGSTLHTIIEDGSTTGDQNTGVLFLNFLDSFAPDILTPTASFSMTGLLPTGNAVIVSSSTVLQGFNGGTMSLYDASNNLLLSGTIGSSTLSGALGNDTGGLFVTTGVATGGSVLPYLDASTFKLSMNFTNIRQTGVSPPNDVGLGINPPLPGSPPTLYTGSTLNPFTADATVDVQASIPEPAGVALLVAGGALAMAAWRRHRRR